MIKAILRTTIKFAGVKSVIDCPFFGFDKYKIKTKAIKHIKGTGFVFRPKEEEYFLDMGYFLSADHEVEFHLTFLE